MGSQVSEFLFLLHIIGTEVDILHLSSVILLALRINMLVAICQTYSVIYSSSCKRTFLVTVVLLLKSFSANFLTFQLFISEHLVKASTLYI